MKRRFNLATLFVLIAAVAILLRAWIFANPRIDVAGEVVAKPGGEPVSGVHLSVKSMASGEVTKVQADGNGRYRLTSVEPGYYTVYADDDDWVSQRAQIYLAEKGSPPFDKIRVTKGCLVTVTIHDPQTGLIDEEHTTVRMEQGVGQPAPVYARNRGRQSDGTFKLRVTPGRTKLEFSGNTSRNEIRLQLEPGQRLDLDFLSHGRELHPVVTNPKTGNSYVIFMEGMPARSFNEAQAYTESLIFRGTPGHLATITSNEEHDFILEQSNVLRRMGLDVPANLTTVLGGTDEEEEGVWRWVCGPEKGKVFYRVGEKMDSFQVWQRMPGMMQPDNHLDPDITENYLTWQISSSGTNWWNDLSPDFLSFRATLVEFSPAGG